MEMSNWEKEVRKLWNEEKDCPKGMEQMKYLELTNGRLALDYVVGKNPEQWWAIIAAIKEMQEQNLPLEQEAVRQLAIKIYLEKYPDPRQEQQQNNPEAPTLQ